MSSENAQNSRVGHLDLAAGILMLWVMTFHAVNNAKVFGDVDARVAIPFLTFSMGWFFYKSGAFFKDGRGMEGIRKDARRLLVPFLKWAAVGYAIHLIMMAVDGTFDIEHCILKPLDTFYIYGYIPIDVPIWFLLSLFVVKFISTWLLKWKIHPVIPIILGFGIASIFHIMNNPRIPYYLSNIPMGLAFFMLGYWLNKYESKKWLIALCAAGYVLFLIGDTPVVGLHRNIHLAGNYYLWPVFCYCGIVFFDNLCKWIRLLLDKWGCNRFRPFSYLGKNSILLLISHGLIYMTIIHYSKLSPMATFLIIEALYLFVLIPAIVVWDKRKAISK